MTKRIIILALGDTHAGSKLGLTHPNTELERSDEAGKIIKYNPELSDTQKFLFYEVYRPAIKSAMDFAGNDDVHVIHTGDPTDGAKYIEDKQSLRVADQVLIADMNMQEILQYENVKRVRIVEGTPSHGFDGSSEDLLTVLLRRKYPKKDIAHHAHGLYHIKEIDTIIDTAHHGPSAGIRKWLEGNNFRYYLRDILIREALRKRPLPDIILRADKHTAAKEFISLEDHDAWGFITPPLQFPTKYAKQVTNSVFEVKIGMLMIEIVLHNSGRKSIAPFFLTKTIDIRNKEIW